MQGRADAQQLELVGDPFDPVQLELVAPTTPATPDSSSSSATLQTCAGVR